MIILIFPMGAIFFALARGGKFVNLGMLRFRLIILIFSGFAIQLIIFQKFWQANSATRPFTPIAYLISVSLLLVSLALNHRVAGVKLLLAGFLLNAFAIVANGGYMPVSPEARAISGQSPIAHGETLNNVIGFDSGTRLVFLGDIFPIPLRASFSSYQISNPQSTPQSQRGGQSPIAHGETLNNLIGTGSGTRLPFLGDIFPIPKGLPFPNVFSVGDFIIAFGAAYLIYKAMLAHSASKPS